MSSWCGRVTAGGLRSAVVNSRDGNRAACTNGDVRNVQPVQHPPGNDSVLGVQERADLVCPQLRTGDQGLKYHTQRAYFGLKV